MNPTQISLAQRDAALREAVAVLPDDAALDAAVEALSAEAFKSMLLDLERERIEVSSKAMKLHAALDDREALLGQLGDSPLKRLVSAHASAEVELFKRMERYREKHPSYIEQAAIIASLEGDLMDAARPLLRAYQGRAVALDAAVKRLRVDLDAR